MARPRDYQLYGFSYDALVLGAHSHYFNAQYAATLIDDDPNLEAELSALRALFDARAQGLHQIVWWQPVDRTVCTCGLVLTEAITQDEAVGHVDFIRHELAGTVIIRTPEGDFAACQHCAARSEHGELAELRSWQRVHCCPPDAQDLGFDDADVRLERTEELYFYRRMARALRAAHPRSSGELA